MGVLRVRRGLAVPVLMSGGFTPSDVPQVEADALIAFYDATDGDNWTDNTGWTTDPVVDNWTGVTVSGGHVTELDLHGDANVDGNGLGELSPLTSLTRLRLGSTGVSGDIADIATLISLTRLYLHNTSVSGDIADISTLTSLTFLRLYNTSVSGDIADISTLTSLTRLYLYNTSVSGDIADISTLTSLTVLQLYNTSVSGDIADIATLTSLTELYLYDTGVSQGTIGTMTAITVCRVQDCGWTEAAVDALLADMYAERANFTDGTPELNIGGTNAAPSGTYQDGDPPTTGLEYVYEVVNDPEAEGFNTWSITYSGGSAP
jgi:Leucine-rich repeat (LRR) protein